MNECSLYGYFVLEMSVRIGDCPVSVPTVQYQVSLFVHDNECDHDDDGKAYKSAVQVRKTALLMKCLRIFLHVKSLRNCVWYKLDDRC